MENQAFLREGVYLTLTSNIALAAIQEASLRGQIAATQRIITLQTQLLGILRQQNERGQIALPDVLSQETALAQAKLLLPPLEKAPRKKQDRKLAVSERALKDLDLWLENTSRTFSNTSV